MSHEINAKIAGVFMYPEGKQSLKDMKAGDAFAFQPEPENQHARSQTNKYVHVSYSRAAGKKPRPEIKMVPIRARSEA